MCPILNAQQVLANNRVCFLFLVTLSSCEDVDGIIVGRDEERIALPSNVFALKKIG